MKRQIIAAAGLVGLAFGAQADPVPIEAFAKEPNISSLSMSNDGTYMVGLIATPGEDNETLSLASWELPDTIDTSKALVPTRITPPNNKMRFAAIQALPGDKVFVVGRQAWTGQTFCTEGGGFGAVKTFVTKFYVGSKDLDDLDEGIAGLGTERLRDKQLAQCRDLNNTTGISNTLPLEDDYVIVTYNNIASGETEYYRVNMRTEEKTFLYNGSGRQGISFTDPRNGRILVRQGIEPAGEGDWRIETYMLNEETGSMEREEPLDYLASNRYQMDVGGYDEASGRYYMITDKFSDKAAVYFYDPKTNQFSNEPVFAHPDFSATSVVLGTDEENWNEPLGFRYAAATVETYWLDPELRSIQEGLEQAFSGQMIDIIDAAKDGNRILFSTEAADQPPAYYLLINRNKVVMIGDSRPWIDESDIGTTELIYYPARDGLSIPGLLSLPDSYDKTTDGRIPTVILPHGGPWARDYAGWDISGWVPFLTSRGYAVLQPQYRGSTGFGRELWFAGDKEWGQAMQDDKDDGAQYLVDQGIADPDKMAIFGYSYGGFAAFAATVRENSPYQCAISGAGVSNLSLFNRLWSSNRIQRIVQGNTLAGMDPSKNTEKANIPILVYHGDRDVRVPIEEGRGFYNAVRNRVNAKFVEIKDMPHSLPWWPDHHRQSLKAIDDWLKSDNCFG
ncbi:MAG TPA: S9 family peptidase [Henriciella marina]|uniref:alpha/beta hydrolase family protein n=1 Tax=Henriciella sp. TaxID=1968823 RepID=UPI00185A25BD|nr:prolyl oligopeptidase family serine peptidase [Henriciella sp.]HIG22781.1 S9 family peptidase [Henriciella sp.]HIK64119.1 S9 family peptidase [Henriciella marina]